MSKCDEIITLLLYHMYVYGHDENAKLASIQNMEGSDHETEYAENPYNPYREPTQAA